MERPTSISLLSPALARFGVICACVALAVGLACRSQPERAETQPLPQAESFGSGSFDEIPRYPQSEPLSEPIEEGRVTTQTFSTLRATPKEVLNWYERELAREGWESARGAERFGRSGYRGMWTKDDRRLLVAASQGPEAETPSGRDRATQFSLVLRPVGE